ncbi:RING/U-box superfamily protein [Prunus dulcis]|uniref:RING/U-box superfamily protein n=1 Tax=Prunus dulcis TaxID=3755 RepID=A0A4Y1RJB9_PRUDU|nr:RING/U-box superfamily protein [Prunus dulcis]
MKLSRIDCFSLIFICVLLCQCHSSVLDLLSSLVPPKISKQAAKFEPLYHLQNLDRLRFVQQKNPTLSFSNPTTFCLYLTVMEPAELQRVGVVQRVPLLIINFVAGALVLLCALAGFFTGGIAGALAGKASDKGVVRGAGLGAVAGAVLSVEILEASRDLLRLGRPGSRRSSLMAEITEELICWRFEEENLAPPEGHTANQWQVTFANLRRDEIYDAFGGSETKGLSRDVLKKLPSHVIVGDTRAAQVVFQREVTSPLVGIARDLKSNYQTPVWYRIYASQGDRRLDCLIVYLYSSDTREDENDEYASELLQDGK